MGENTKIETDRELLELAAKAAGIEVGNWSETYSAFWLEYPHVYWNPLTDDGDALRLAVKMHLLIDTDHCCAMSITKTGAEPGDWADGKLDDDPYAATRRAIVRAAAAIGRAGQ